MQAKKNSPPLAQVPQIGEPCRCLVLGDLFLLGDILLDQRDD
jgi:hypothetical protein